MNKKASLTFTICVIVALIAVIVVFSLRVYFERSEKIRQNAETYTTLQNTIASSYLAKGTFSHPYFSSSIRTFIKDHPSVISIIIYAAEGPLYIYTNDSDILAFSGNENILDWDGTPIFLIRPFFEQVRSSELSIPTRQGVYLSTVYTVLTDQRLFFFIRDSIIAVAALLVITLIFMALYPFMREKSRPSTAEADLQPSSASNGNSDTASAAVLNADEGSRNRRCNSGLFSPTTGLGWEQYLDSRLSFELRRAASYDQDLVLALLRSSDLQHGSAEYIRIAKYMLQHFMFQDMLFEYGKNGYAIILPNTDLDTAIKDVKSFRENVCEKHVSKCVFSAGLSSRNGRLINGNRLITESSMALSKAFNDPVNKTIAFRPDPEKYRQYIASKY